ncbi:Trp biosynthesis-associated membrane protein [Blastococcus sp. PRF04-17]|nr:Trp biosynthesis-associated membrane protein [Blastococcus sp. PRF04-17]UOY02846.1 Trp biosynthesis-associated membrane protein [Blastococcus sp. PRF04-17]
MGPGHLRAVGAAAPGGRRAERDRRRPPGAGRRPRAAGGGGCAARGPGRGAGRRGPARDGGGGALAWSGGHALGGGLDERAAMLAGIGWGRVVDLATVPSWPTLAVGAGVLAVGAGVLVVLRGRRWPAMGRRYERTPAGAPAPARRSDEDRAQDAWQALDRGEDPTA